MSNPNNHEFMKPNPVGSSGVASTSLSVTSQSTIAKPQTPGIGPLDSRNPNSLSAVSHSEALGIKQLIGNEMLVGPGTTPSITPRINLSLPHASNINLVSPSPASGLASNSPMTNSAPSVQQRQQFQEYVKILLQKRQTGQATPQELATLQKLIWQQQQQSTQQHQFAMQQKAILMQQQQSVQQKMAQAQAQARLMQPRQAQLMTKPHGPQQQQRIIPPPQRSSLGPAQNTYGPRIQKGGTGLVINVSIPEPAARAATRRGRFTEDYFSDEHSSESDEVTDSEDEDQMARRQAKRELKAAAAQPAKVTEVAPYKPRKRTRLLLSTKHEYEKMHIYQLEQIANAKDVLVPISVEIDIDASYKFQDSFTWNLNESSMTPEKFAEYICLDLNLNPAHHQASIFRSIRSQLEDYKKYFLYSDTPIPQDTRTIIKLDITVGKVQLRDRFEWDMASFLTPEDFASVLVSDLHLGGEFISLISHSIREQLYKVKSNGDFDPSFAIEKPFRSEEEAKSWSPFIDCGDREGEEGLSIEEDRKQRLLRRQLRVNSSNRNSRAGVQRGYLLNDDPNSSTAPIVGSSHPAVNSTLSAEEKAAWRCSHCYCNFTQTSTLFKGPKGDNSLCKNCGLYYEEDDSLPEHRFEMFK